MESEKEFDFLGQPPEKMSGAALHAGRPLVEAKEIPSADFAAAFVLTAD